MKSKLLSERELNTIRGKCLVMAATRDELFSVFGHIDELEMKLTELDDDDKFGTEGWRHAFGVPTED